MTALGEAHVRLRLLERDGAVRFEELEVIRQHAGLSVERFCSLAGIPRPSWYRQVSGRSVGRP